MHVGDGGRWARIEHARANAASKRKDIFTKKVLKELKKALGVEIKDAADDPMETAGGAGPSGTYATPEDGGGAGGASGSGQAAAGANLNHLMDSLALR
jgi:hypothetical protein